MLASLPCCSPPALILPGFSPDSIKHLRKLLKSGDSPVGRIHSFKEVYDIIDNAKILNIDVSDLRNVNIGKEGASCEDIIDIGSQQFTGPKAQKNMIL